MFIHFLLGQDPFSPHFLVYSIFPPNAYCIFWFLSVKQDVFWDNLSVVFAYELLNENRFGFLFRRSQIQRTCRLIFTDYFISLLLYFLYCEGLDNFLQSLIIARSYDSKNNFSYSSAQKKRNKFQIERIVGKFLLRI